MPCALPGAGGWAQGAVGQTILAGCTAVDLFLVHGVYSLIDTADKKQVTSSWNQQGLSVRQ
jgi:hypothetical protein